MFSVTVCRRNASCTRAGLSR